MWFRYTTFQALADEHVPCMILDLTAHTKVSSIRRFFTEGVCLILAEEFVLISLCRFHRTSVGGVPRPEGFVATNEELNDLIDGREQTDEETRKDVRTDHVVESLSTCSMMNDVQRSWKRPEWHSINQPLMHTDETTILRMTEALTAHAMKMRMRMNDRQKRLHVRHSAEYD